MNDQQHNPKFLMSINSITDFIRDSDPQVYNQLMNITSVGLLPEDNLVSTTEISQGKLMNDLDRIAFNGLRKGTVKRLDEVISFVETKTTLEEEKLQEKKTQEQKQKKTGLGCKCKKTGCLKMYCECFNMGMLCTQQCGCLQCGNHTKNLQVVARARKEVKLTTSRNCHCKKSQCQKKYCQCYTAGTACSQACKCQDCQNGKNHDHHELIPKFLRV